MNFVSHYIKKEKDQRLVTNIQQNMSFELTNSYEHLYIYMFAYIPFFFFLVFSYGKNNLLITIDAKDAYLVHVGELGNNENHHSECVEEQPWMSVICRMRCYQIPVFIFKCVVISWLRNQNKIDNKIFYHVKNK